MKFYDAIIQTIVRHINFDSKCYGELYNYYLLII